MCIAAFHVATEFEFSAPYMSVRLLPFGSFVSQFLCTLKFQTINIQNIYSYIEHCITHQTFPGHSRSALSVHPAAVAHSQTTCTSWQDNSVQCSLCLIINHGEIV